MPNSSGNGNIMVERTRTVAKSSFAICRVSFGRRLIDSMRCGATSRRHKRSSSMATSQESLKQLHKSRLHAENLDLCTSQKQGRSGSQENAFSQINVSDKEHGFSAGLARRPADSEQLGKPLKNSCAHDWKSSSNTSASDDLDWKQLVECLRKSSKDEWGSRSERMKQEITSTEERNEIQEVEKKIKAFNDLQTIAQSLQFGNESVQQKAAQDVRRHAKDDAQARVTLAMLGVIPPLVGMLDCSEAAMHISVLFALLNLAIGNDLNKAAIVKAGAVHKMVMLLQASNESVREAVVANFLSLSALDVNKPIIGSSGAIPFLVNIMQHGSTQGRKDSLRALYNLSICRTNVQLIVDTGVVEFLLNMIEDMDVSEKVLGMLSNLAATEEGRGAIAKNDEGFPVLIDVLNWVDAPKCQEKASYILMIMAHNSWSHRRAMVEADIVSTLLELTLLGTTLAQKRASRILECIREDKKRRTSPISAPIISQQTDTETINNGENGGNMSEERKVVKRLVQQSLQHNMQRIIKRANLPQDFVPSDHLKSLTATASSKSLPF